MSWRALFGVLTLFLLLPAAAPAATPGPDSGVTAAPTHSAGAPPVSYADGKRRAPQWYTSSEQAGVTRNCVLQYYEELGMAWTGWYGDLGVSPQKNDVYYLVAGWGVSGNPCGGGAYVHDEFVLPAHTQLAISNQNKVVCWHQSPGQDQLYEFTQDCPQSPQTGTYGGYAFDPPGSDEGAWPTATGAIFEIWIPVKTSAPLDGLESPDGQPCYTCVYAGIWMIDGWNSPWVWPRQGVYVGGGGGSVPPAITYPGPSTTGVTYNTVEKGIEVRLLGNLFTEGTTGVAHFELGNTNGNNINVSPAGNYQAYEDWRMTPGKKYTWRLCYKPAGDPEICGVDQIFQAPPDTGIGDVTVKRRKATVDFASPPAQNMIVSFQCKLDNGPYKPCTNPQIYKNLSKGNHTVSVRAVDQDGHKDSTPAQQSFRI